MAKHRHILIVASWFPSEQCPTEASFILEQTQLLQQAGHKVHVLIPRLSGSFIQTLQQQPIQQGTGVYEGIEFTAITQRVWAPGIRRFFMQQLHQKVVHWFKTYMQQHGKPDVIHSHAAFMGAVTGAVLSKKFHVPLVHTEHTSGLIFQPEQYSAHDIQLLRSAMQTASRVVFVSKFAAEQTMQRHQIKTQAVQILPNLVHHLFFDAPLVSAGRKNVTFVCIGNFIPVKNQLLLMQAWQLVHASNPSWKLVLIGDGENKKSLQEFASHGNMEHSLEWKERLNREDIVQQMQQADVIVSSSRLETFGLTLAEGLALGKPVVATDSGGPRDFVTAQTGMLVPQDDPKSLADALMYVGTHLSDYPGELLRETALRQFSAPVILKQLEAVYEEIST